MAIPTFVKKDNNNVHSELASKLFHMRTQFHIFHLLANGIGSYAKHKALNSLYDNVLDKADTIIETLQGKLGSNIRGYKSYPYLEDDSVESYIKECINYLESYRNGLPKPKFDNIDNQIQTLIDDLEQTLYLLTLK